MSLLNEERAVVDPPRPLIIAVLGYYLVGLAAAMGQYASFGDVTLWRVLVGGASLGVVHVVVFGVIGIWLGSKIFRGAATLSGSVHAAGACMLLPGIVGVPLSALLLLPWTLARPMISLLVVFLMLLVGLWAWIRIWFAVRALNGFGTGRTWGVMLWLPVLVVVIGFVSYLVTTTV